MLHEDTPMTDSYSRRYCFLPRAKCLTLVLTGLLALAASTGARADEIKIGGTGAALATMQLLADAYARSHPGTQITVLRSLGSNGGIKAVLAGNIQIAVTARALTEAETQQGAGQIEYGRTPFVFATAASNKVTGVTTRELADIYAGRTEQWPDGTKIRLVLRPVGDSDSEMIKAISPEVREAKTAAEQRKGMAFAVSDQDSADALEKIPGAFGASTLAQLLTEKRALKALRFDDVEPNAKNIDNGSYPLYKRLYLATSAKTPLAAHQFVAFVQSAPGRAILRRTGHAVK
jgi:phosphate transport system substrate-binding protein